MFDIEQARKRKARFLESEFFPYEESVKNNIQIVFNKAEVIEIQQECDLAEFNIDKVYKLLKYYNSRSKGYLNLIAYYFSNYFSYCLSEGFIDSRDVKNYYAPEFSKSIIDDILPLQLLEEKYITEDILINSYMNSFDDYVLKLLLYTPFIGIYGSDYEDIINLKITDLNKEEKTIKLYSGRIARVDDLFIELMKKANAEDYYHPEGDSGYNKDNDRRNYLETEFVIKPAGLKQEAISRWALMNRYRDIQNVVGNKMVNCGNLYLSGLINYIKKRHEENGISLRQAFTEKSSGKEYMYEQDTQKYIYEFGSKLETRTLRYKVKDIIELF